MTTVIEHNAFGSIAGTANQVGVFTDTNVLGGSDTLTWDNTNFNFVAQPVWIGHPPIIGGNTNGALLGTFQCVIDGSQEAGMLGCDDSIISGGAFSAGMVGSSDGTIQGSGLGSGLLGTSTSGIYSGSSYVASIGSSYGIIGATVDFNTHAVTPSQGSYYSALAGVSFCYLDNGTYSFIGGGSTSFISNGIYVGMVGVSDCSIINGAYSAIVGSSSSTIGTVPGADSNYCFIGGGSGTIGASADNSAIIVGGTVQDNGNGIVIGGGTINSFMSGIAINGGTINHTNAVVIGSATSFDDNSILLSANVVGIGTELLVFGNIGSTTTPVTTLFAKGNAGVSDNLSAIALGGFLGNVTTNGSANGLLTLQTKFYTYGIADLMLNNGDGPIAFLRSNGTYASPTAVGLGDDLGTIIFSGYGGAVFSTLASIAATAQTSSTGNITVTAAPSSWTFASDGTLTIPDAGIVGTPLRFHTDFATPASLTDGDFWIEATGTTPTATINLMARRDGASHVVATMTY